MRKGIKFKLVVIDHGKLTAYDEDHNEVKLTRLERSIMINYKSNTYIEDIKHMFSNPNIVADDFKVISDGKEVFNRTL